MTIKLRRDCRPEPDKVFWAAPFGTKSLSNGEPFDFDAFFTDVIVPICEKAGLKALRSDQVYGKGDPTGTAWWGIQVAGVVLVDFTIGSANVAAEFALALALGKRIVVLVQDPADIPSDVAGHFRYSRYGNDWQSMERLRTELPKELLGALEQPSAEMILVPMHVGGSTPVPGEVVIAERDFVMVLTDDRRRVVLNAADVDARRIIPDMARRFPIGTRVQGSFEVDLAGDAKYTLIPGQINPWPALEAEYPPGTEFRSRVDSVIPGLGVFVHVAHGVNGLVPEHKINGRAPGAGDDVEVAVTTLDAERRRIGLRLDRVVSSAGSAVPRQLSPVGPHRAGGAGEADLPEVGAALLGTVSRVVPEADGAGGFVLLRVEGLRRPVMLHCTAMSEDMRGDLHDGFVELGEQVPLEVVKVDQRASKVLVRDVPDLEADRDEDREEQLAIAG